MSYTPLTNSTIITAVNAWITDPTQAQFTDSNNSPYYGHISNWDTSQVTDMSNLFLNKTTFDDDISGWNVSNVTNMLSMFDGATTFNQDISGWDTSNVTNMKYMFYYATSMDQPDIKYWNTTNVPNPGATQSGYFRMFDGATKMLNYFPADPTSANFNQPRPITLKEELQAIDNNDTSANLSNASDNKKRLAIALAKLT